ncbi:hypothetical protein AB0E67_10665 [Streptomyces sp. NPDC032161]|uniref:hypothetical protein n=1 Tax=unclassified Streptomyces TaxID=2593676 RepID=UPI0033EDFBA4
MYCTVLINNGDSGGVSHGDKQILLEGAAAAGAVPVPPSSRASHASALPGPTAEPRP